MYVWGQSLTWEAAFFPLQSSFYPRRTCLLRGRESSREGFYVARTDNKEDVGLVKAPYGSLHIYIN